MKDLKIHIFLILSSIILGSLPGHAAPQCSILFNEQEATAEQANLQIEKDRTSWSEYTAHNDGSALDFLQEAYKNDNFDYIIPFNEAQKILNDVDLPLYGEILRDVIQNLKNSSSNVRSVTNAKFEKALKETLQKHQYSPGIIKKKIAALKSDSKKDWKSILGDLTLAETHELFYGDNINKPSVDSLIGQYIKETGAQMKMVQFPTAPGGNKMGPAKMVIAVSNSSFETFKKLILSNKHYMSVVGHANVLHQGSFYSFGGQKSEIRAPGTNTPMPLLVVKTTESQRLTRYMQLTTDPHYMDWYGPNKLKKPWYLQGYCAKGGYECCTHWLGNIPIGDKRVKEYSFPPGEYNNKKGPQVKPLKDYTVPKTHEDLKLVWKSPGHQQLSHVIGQKKANDIGEMASPGYVIHTLVGPTKAERVPVIFWMTRDHKDLIPDNPYLEFERPH